MRIKVEGKKSEIINKSTKCKKYEDAYLFAVEEYNRISEAIRLGRGIETWTFLKDWILEILHENNCNIIGNENDFNRFINKQTKFETEDDIDEILIAGYEKELFDQCLT